MTAIFTKDNNILSKNYDYIPISHSNNNALGCEVKSVLDKENNTPIYSLRYTKTLRSAKELQVYMRRKNKQKREQLYNYVVLTEEEEKAELDGFLLDSINIRTHQQSKYIFAGGETEIQTINNNGVTSFVQIKNIEKDQLLVGFGGVLYLSKSVVMMPACRYQELFELRNVNSDVYVNDLMVAQ